MTDPLHQSGSWRVTSDPAVPVVSDKTHVPLGLAWTVGGALLAVAFAAGSAHYRIADQAEDAEKQAAETAMLRDRMEAREVHAAEAAADFRHIISALERMQGQLDRIERRSARRDEP